MRIASGQLVFNSSFTMRGKDSALVLPVTGVTNNARDLNALSAFDDTLTLYWNACSAGIGGSLNQAPSIRYAGVRRFCRHIPAQPRIRT